MPVKEVHMLATTTGQINKYGVKRFLNACDIFLMPAVTVMLQL